MMDLPFPVDALSKQNRHLAKKTTRGAIFVFATTISHQYTSSTKKSVSCILYYSATGIFHGPINFPSSKRLVNSGRLSKISSSKPIKWNSTLDRLTAACFYSMVLLFWRPRARPTLLLPRGRFKNQLLSIARHLLPNTSRVYDKQYQTVATK